MSKHDEAKRGRLLEAKDKVFDEWVGQLRSQVQYAEQVPPPVLMDTLPIFYDHLVELACGKASEFNRSTLASEHGGERARLTRFSAESVAHEFQLFRGTVLQVWEECGVQLSMDEVEAVECAIDNALRDSLTGYILTETALREQFFSALTHDLRTPLATANMAVQMIQHTDTSERVARLANIAARQHEVMSQMISSLLDMMVLKGAGSTALEFDELNMQLIVTGVVECTRLSSGRTIDIDADSVHGYWNGSAIRRAIENLLNNAVKYSPDGTPIQVSVKAYRDRVILGVSNQGTPIPADQLEAIFQLFRRAEQKPGSNGWGIGLPYVRSVAERHAGSIAVESNDITTRFIFDIPIDPRQIVSKVL